MFEILVCRLIVVFFCKCARFPLKAYCTHAAAAIPLLRGGIHGISRINGTQADFGFICSINTLILVLLFLTIIYPRSFESDIARCLFVVSY